MDCGGECFALTRAWGNTRRETGDTSPDDRVTCFHTDMSPCHPVKPSPSHQYHDHASGKHRRMTSHSKRLYYDDSYLTQFEAIVVSHGAVNRRGNVER
jgi:hypothetical protein